MCAGLFGGGADFPTLPSVDPEIARKKAAETARVAEERRRRVQKGGRLGTILAGQKVAEEEQQRKTLLGQ